MSFSWDWYTGTAYNRLMPGGAIVVISHRMHEDDLAGRLLAQQAAGGDRPRAIMPPMRNYHVEYGFSNRTRQWFRSRDWCLTPISSSRRRGRFTLGLVAHEIIKSVPRPVSALGPSSEMMREDWAEIIWVIIGGVVGYNHSVEGCFGTGSIGFFVGGIKFFMCRFQSREFRCLNVQQTKQRSTVCLPWARCAARR